ncbi:hypothetical protein [Curtobacterium sp. Leaf261]|uniref:hypothetical protein n=1 Tax=Curtobacterium sp. Leaf261 TaxID=1736311 RepID=UPI0006F316A8|nr:hypothetical protein [Curtobacterium sp. Leaf261]KQO59981.1 hypothetical protein ASF23_15120 [Curtobacterium sp. Leaf261]
MSDDGKHGSVDGPTDPYEREPGYETEVDGTSGRTPTDVVAGIGIGVLALIAFGFFHVAVWIAFPVAIVVALLAWQLLAARRRRKRRVHGDRV